MKEKLVDEIEMLQDGSEISQFRQKYISFCGWRTLIFLLYVGAAAASERFAHVSRQFAMGQEVNKQVAFSFSCMNYRWRSIVAGGTREPANFSSKIRHLSIKNYVYVETNEFRHIPLPQYVRLLLLSPN